MTTAKISNEIPINLSDIGGVVAYTLSDGRRIISSWSGPTIRIHGKFNCDVASTPIGLLRQHLVEAYPAAGRIPPKYFEVTCLSKTEEGLRLYEEEVKRVEERLRISRLARTKNEN